jgi:outer membrane murein-binding lipoprotein Lpp
MKLLGVGARAASVVLLAGVAASWMSAQAQDPAQKLKAIQQRLEQEKKDWSEVYRAAKTDGEKEALLEEYPGPEFLPEFKALALEAKGTEVAAQAWTEVHRLASRTKDKATVKEAIERLATDHVAWQGLGNLCASLGKGEPDAKLAMDVLRKIQANSPHAEVKAAAEASLFELEHLQVGMKAPDFEAVDQGGEGFRLSDYAGKVVLVDFWGFW